MKIGYAFVLLFLGYVAWKYYGVRPAVAGKARPSQAQLRPGMSVYCGTAAPQKSQQLQAFKRRNNMQTTQFGFSPALGPQENQPYRVMSIEV
jgi:hypothetical protein